MILLAATLSYKIKRHSEASSELLFDPVAKSKIQVFLSIAFCIALIFAITSFIFLTLQNPHGGWDAWTIWNLRARFLFRGADHWTDAAFVYWFKPDYPLLIPATIARYWTHIGSETVIIPGAIALLFTFATVVLSFSSLSTLRGKSQGILAGLILLATPFFIAHGASQYADVPLGFFILATLALVALHQRSKNHRPLLGLAGMTAGLSAWTKNEGLLFVVAVIVALFAAIVSIKGWKSYLREMPLFLAGLLPVLALVVCFKINFAPTNDLVLGQNINGTIARLTDPSRYIVVLKSFGRGVFYFGDWSHVLNIPILLTFYTLILGINVDEADRAGVAVSLLALSFMSAGYFLIYVTTPHDLSWHLDDSLHRVLLQLWPSVVYIYFMITRPPELAISNAEARHA